MEPIRVGDRVVAIRDIIIGKGVIYPRGTYGVIRGIATTHPRALFVLFDGADVPCIVLPRALKKAPS